MKKALHYCFSFLLILLLLSCKSQKPLQEVTKESTDQTDFTSVKETTEINKEIADRLIWQLSQVKTSDPKCDSITQAYLYEVMRYFNTQKTSGGNGYSLKFNEMEKQLELLVNIAETKTSSKDSIAERVTIKEFHHTREIPVREPLKWYEKTLMITGLVLGAWQIFKLTTFIKKQITNLKNKSR